VKRLKSVLLLLFISFNTKADIFKYIDAKGGVHITNKAVNGHNYQVLVRSRPETYKHDLNYLAGNKLRYSQLITEAAERHQIDERLLHAVIQAESAYNANAVSSAGAVGLMQLMPDTARRYGVMDRRDAEQNIDGGTRYLKDLLAMFNSNLILAVAGYNAGEGAVMKYNYNVPPFPETRNYVQQVLMLYDRG